MKSHFLTIQMKPLQQYFHIVLFIWHVVLTFESVDQIPWCYHSNETSSAVLSHGAIYVVCCCCDFLSLWMKSYSVTIHETSLAALLHGAINLVGFYKEISGRFGNLC